VYRIQGQEDRQVNFITNPAEIEKRSFEIISEKLEGRKFDPQTVNVIKRVIHATADFDYADNLVFSDGAAAIARDTIKNGARIVTDTQMAKAGINKKAVEQFGCNVYCFMDAPEVAEISQANGFTRARAAVDRAVETLETPIAFVVGNAPTALIRLYELITSREFIPVFIIAVPVGFVNVVESKELILGLKIPHIVAKGQKGGSNAAAAICNALLYEMTERSWV
jgi:precorrin-8X/cobalt-precorrin-8 methylmutase